MSTDAAAFREDPTGLEDVVRSVRALARTARALGESAIGIAEREVAMAVKITEQLRDGVVSAKALERARAEDLPARLRHDAHRMLDLAADVGALAYVTGIDFLERLTDERRPKLPTPAA